MRVSWWCDPAVRAFRGYPSEPGDTPRRNAEQSNPSPGGSGTAAVRKRSCRIRQPIGCSTVSLTTVAPSAPAACLPVENPFHDRVVGARAASLHRSCRAETSGARSPSACPSVNGTLPSAHSPQPGFYLPRLRHARSANRLDRQTRIHDNQAFSGCPCFGASYRVPVPATNDRQVAQLVGSPTRPHSISRGTPPGSPVVRRVALQFFYRFDTGQDGKSGERGNTVGARRWPTTCANREIMRNIGKRRGTAETLCRLHDQ